MNTLAARVLVTPRDLRLTMKPSDAQIRDVASPVRYEITLFIGLYTRLCRGETPMDWVISNACLEAWLLHARNLIAFFEISQKDRHKDDVVSQDYGFSAQPLPINNTIRGRLNTDLAHLTFSRIARTRNTAESRKAKQWNLEEFVPLLERCDEFVQHIRCEYLAGPDDAQQCSEWTKAHSEVRTLLALLDC